ncbi:glycosyltransferase [Olleya namhaensis]|nr:glycosyltransferase [Olleya namhaensis]
MRFLIITHVLHKSNGLKWYAYAPYVREMNLWLKHVDEVEIVAPVTSMPLSEIDIAYSHDHITLTQIPAIAFINISRGIKSLLALPYIFLKLWKACQRADHIHLRCPGNIGLLGCFVQVFFPNKVKTAKYAGNWDPNAKQPLSYRLQKTILSNTKYTKKMTALVYGEWPNQTKNIKSFFTATYRNQDRVVPVIRDYTKALEFVFVGSLVTGKRPLLAIQIVEQLLSRGVTCKLQVFGDGVLKPKLQQYIDDKQLGNSIVLHGNKTSETVKTALQSAHFTILASKSEGWPKALAEAMFFGVIPIATSISCVPNMLDYGKRGILIAPNLEEAVSKIVLALESKQALVSVSRLASDWSQQYTLDVFESEIKKLLKS